MVDMQVRFVLDPANLNYGKIVVTITTDYGASTTHKVGITGPDGVVKALPGSPDATGVNATVLADIPLTSSGAFLYGDYTFNIIVDDDGLGSTVLNETYEWCFPSTTPATALTIETTVDCYAKKLVIQDATEYPTNTTQTRLITVQHPLISGENNEADSTTVDDELIVDLTRDSGIAYENTTYHVLVEVSCETSEEIGINSNEDFWDFGIVYAMTPYNKDEKIVCNFDPCKIIECVDDKYRELLDKACARGGIANLNQQDAATFGLLQSYLCMYNWWIRCKDYDKSNYYYELIKGLVGNCGCNAPVGPQPITDSGIIYLAGPSAYELWIQQGNTGTIEDFFNVLYPVGEWIEVSSGDLNGNFQHGTPPLQYRILKTHIEWKGGFKSHIGAPPTASNPFMIVKNTVDPADIDEAAFIPVYKQGTPVGRFFRASNGEWQIYWNSDFNQTQQSDISGMLALVNPTASTNIVTGDWTEFPGGAYANSYGPGGAVPFQWRTDGKFLYLRGSFDGPGWSSGGFTLINASYFTSLGLTLEDGYSFPLIDTSALASKGNPGYVRTNGNALIVHTVSAVLSSDFDPSHTHAVNGVIPLA